MKRNIVLVAGLLLLIGLNGCNISISPIATTTTASTITTTTTATLAPDTTTTASTITTTTTATLAPDITTTMITATTATTGTTTLTSTTTTILSGYRVTGHVDKGAASAGNYAAAILTMSSSVSAGVPPAAAVSTEFDISTLGNDFSLITSEPGTYYVVAISTPGNPGYAAPYGTVNNLTPVTLESSNRDVNIGTIVFVGITVTTNTTTTTMMPIL